MIEEIKHEDLLLGVILRGSTQIDHGAKFYTPNNLNFQLAQMKHKAGYQIVPHLHKNFQRVITGTTEALIVKSGKIKVNFYDLNKQYLKNAEIAGGDIIMLFQGGHGFEIIDDAEFYEIKQGPFAGTDADKEKFEVNNG